MQEKACDDAVLQCVGDNVGDFVLAAASNKRAVT
jgi:hypothetical protein